MYDFLEILENSAEDRLYEMTEGLPKGKFKCFCGRIADLEKEANPSASNPYCMPICNICYEEE